MRWGTRFADFALMCTDSSILAFTDSTGNPNAWGDSWRGDDQKGTVWSLFNKDYPMKGKFADYKQGRPGYKGSGNVGTYEIFVM